MDIQNQMKLVLFYINGKPFIGKLNDNVALVKKVITDVVEIFQIANQYGQVGLAGFKIGDVLEMNLDNTILMQLNRDSQYYQAYYQVQTGLSIDNKNIH